MSKLANIATRVYMDEFDISGDMNAFTLNINQVTPVVTAFSDTGPRRVVGDYDYDASYTGFLEPTTVLSDEQIFALLGSATDHFIASCPGANAEGSIVYEGTYRLTGEPRSADVGNVVMVSFDVAGSGGLVRGVILGNSTETGSGQSTGRNQGATVSPEEYQVVFRLLAFTGTDITMKVQESSNDGGGDPYADISGLTSGALTGIGVVRVSVTASTEAWKRLDFSGTFSSATILVTGGTVTGT